MFLRRLSSSSVSIPSPPLCWPVWGCRPPPGTPGHRDLGRHRFRTTSGLMEAAHRSREPPHKRRRSAEEKEAQQGGGASAKTPGPGSMQGGPQERRDTGAWTGRGPQQGHTTQPSNQGQVGGANWPHINQGQVGGANTPPSKQPSNQGQVGGTDGSSTNNGMMGGGNRSPPPPRSSLLIKALQRHWESCSTDPPSPGGSADPLPPLPPHPPPPPPPLPPGDCPDSPPPLGSSPALPPAGGSIVLDFSVMSYNLLSQELLQDNVYLYRHCSPAVLPWSYRLPNLLAEIRLHRADILCLQEVQHDHYEDQIRPALQDLGYQCEYKKRTGSKPDGCAVVFNSALFSLVSSNPVEFFRAGDFLLDRDNVGQVVLLRPRAADPHSAPPVVCVANTHLLYNPRRGDVKLAQLAVLLAELGRLARLPDGSTNPVLLCGDLNSTPFSPLYRFLTRGRLDYLGLQIGMVSGQEDPSRGQRLLSCPIWSHSLGINQRCQYREAAGAAAVDGAISELSVDDGASSSRATLEHTLTLRSTYHHLLNPDGRSEVTTCHSRTAMTVDYIFYSPDVPSLPGGRGFQLLGRLSLVGRPELQEVHGLPNQHHSSDHLPLLARFRLRF